ncbi:transcription antitermination factor NusB [Phycisphaerales bacterium AB-hyl4]|uniref:Transcription antitermination factor NusB n=1 Tax=Natronomicrosphaera hydrolytica TaxID=3242702 RepID=A0ABV4U6D5_9BACT
MSKAERTKARSAREIATRALADAAQRFPDLPPQTLDTVGLTSAEAALAVAIHRTTLRRWLTLEHVVSRFVKQPMWRLQPTMRAVLLAGAAQLLFMDRLPSYAVVDEMVQLARRLVRPQAAAMVNGVLRNTARLVTNRSDTPWQPAANSIPHYTDRKPGDAPPNGADTPGFITLKRDVFPDPATDLPAHLALATNMPEHVVRRWFDSFDAPTATTLCLHTLKPAPTIVAIEPGFATDNTPTDATPEASSVPPWAPHARPGFIVWQSTHDELTAFLDASPHRRVQDPASAEPVTAVRDIAFTAALDYCAGRGTKTRQLAAAHPDAKILATDINPDRLDELTHAAAGLPNIERLAIDEAKQQQVDLLLLDVPCSNTAVLARRPEARYRLTRKTMNNLLELQRRIIRDALPALAPLGHVLYSTCSLDVAENNQQARWLAKQINGEIIHEHQTLPVGLGLSYHDGSYHALIKRKA